MKLNNLITADLVDCTQGEPMTDSLRIAEKFGKQHKDILKLINSTIKQLSDEFRGRNFAPTIRLISGPKGAKRKGKMFRLTEEGFALTVMGFTGKKALQWKVEFITAFVENREALNQALSLQANALMQIRPRWQAILDYPELTRAELIKMTGHKHPDSITACRARMRSLGLGSLLIH